MLSTFLSLVYSEQDDNPTESINPPPVEQNYNEYNLNLRADYSPVQSIDNNIEPSSNLIIAPDPAKAAQYEANVYNQTTTEPYLQNVSPAAKNFADYEFDENKNPLFEPDNKDSQITHPAESKNKESP